MDNPPEDTGGERSQPGRARRRGAGPEPRRASHVAPVLVVLATLAGMGYMYVTGNRFSPFMFMAVAGVATMLWFVLRSSGTTASIKRAETRPLPTAPPPRQLTAADILQTRDDLLAQWSAYRLDIEAWYITKPLLHDTTGTVPTTVAYERAMQDLIAAADNLNADATQSQIDAAGQLADSAWAAWHEADDYASQVGLGDRSPTERAALQRLGKLVERLTRSTAADPELPNIKRAIGECLDKITTVSTSWTDIAALPAITSTGLLPQIPSTAAANPLAQQMSQQPTQFLQPMTRQPQQLAQPITPPHDK